jgi:proline racemase
VVFVYAGIEKRQHVGMVQASGDLDFAEKAILANRRGQLRPHHFQRNLTLMFEIVGKVNRGHTATADLSDQAVLPGDNRMRVGVEWHAMSVTGSS